MIALASGLHVYLACGIADMRKGMTGLAMLVQQTLAEDPFGSAVFAFRGCRSEQLTADQLQFGLEELEQTIAENQADQDAAELTSGRTLKARAERPARNHGTLPAHLPRYEVVVDAEHGTCPCCGGIMHSIGEVRTEQLDIVPAQLRVRVTRRPRYACRACEGRRW